MSTAAQNLTVKLSVDAQGLITGIEAANKATAGFASGVKTSFGQTAAVARQAAQAQEGLLGKLRDFKSEQIQGAKVAGFYAGQLAEIVPGAAAAKGSIQNLIDIMIGGVGFGSAFSLATFVLGQFADAMMESQRHAAEVRAAYRDTAASVAASMQHVRDSVAGPLTKTEEAWREQTRTVREEVRKANAAAEEMLANRSIIDKIKDTAKFIFDNPYNSSRWQSPTELAAAKLQEAAMAKLAGLESQRPQKHATEKAEEVERERVTSVQIIQINSSSADAVAQINAELQAKLADLKHREKELGQDGARLRVAYEEEAAKKIQRAREDAAQQTRDRIFSIERGGLSDREQIVRETELRLGALKTQLGRTQDPGLKSGIQSQIDAEREEGSRRLRELTEQHRAQKAAGNKVVAEMNEERDRIEQQKRDESKAEWKDYGRQIAGSLVSSWGSALSSMMRGTYDFSNMAKDALLSVGDAILGVIESIAAKFLEEQAAQLAAKLFDATTAAAAVKVEAASTVSAHAAEAGAGAAAAMAAIPVFGPGLALGAMTETSAAVLASMMPLVAAAGGFDVPAGVAPVTQLHPREMVLPADIADPLRRSLADGGVGGAPMVFNFNAPVDRHWWAANQAHIVRELREATRNGVGP